MDTVAIPYIRVPKSSTLFLDFLYDFDKVSSFYTASPFQLSAYQRVAGELRYPNTLRRDLCHILERQNHDFGCAGPTFASIQRLSEPGTYAVATGQQVGLLTGPAFTLSKALTAIRLAQYLSQQGLAVVPVFWLATEDHDLEEVAQAEVFDEDYNLVPLRDAGERFAPRSSVGHVKLSKEITGTLDRLEGFLPAGDARRRLLDDLRDCYQPGVSWGQAFGRLMARLFSRWGVILLDPLHESIHRLCAGVYERALVHARGFRARLLERSQALARASYHIQVRVGHDSTLLFVTRDGNRATLHQDAGERDDEFTLDGAEKISFKELRARLDERPLDFTPSALLRPIVQDALLPTVAYVAGPSELAYLGQSQVLYADFARPQPINFPRAGFTLVDRRVQRLMEKYQVSVEDVWQGEDHFSRKLGASVSTQGSAEGWPERLERTEQELARLLERLREDVQALDPTLLDALQHAKEKMAYQMDRLKGKIARAALARSELLTHHQQMLVRFLAPGKELQERRVSGVSFLGRAGYELLDRLLERIQLDSTNHQIFAY